MKFLKLHLLTLLTFVTLDLLWLGLLAQPFYQSQLKPLLAPTPNLPAAICFYLLYSAGLLYFAIWPAWQAQNPRLATRNGALLGLFAYGTYDLTNLATLAHWPLLLVAVDMLWGTCLTSLSARIGYSLTRKWPPSSPQPQPAGSHVPN